MLERKKANFIEIVFLSVDDMHNPPLTHFIGLYLAVAIVIYAYLSAIRDGAEIDQ